MLKQSNMDYEKEYNEMVRRCKELHESGNALTKQQMEIVCPQLAESEDERIRKGLLRHFKNKTKPYWNEIAVKDIIAYLERLKEQKPALRLVGDGLVSDPNAHFEVVSVQKPTEKQDYSGLTDFERAIHRGFLCAGIENVPVGIIKDTAQDCIAHIKPAEWSEEDMRMLGKCIDAASGYYDPKDKQMMKDFLKSLPERFTLHPSWKPAGWSEKDEYVYNEILKRVADKKLYEHDLEYIYKWLKSLRSSWKPSEEQVYSLGTVVKGYDNCTVGSVGYNLKELYEQLRKLLQL